MGLEEHPTKLSGWSLRELQLLDDPELATQVASIHVPLILSSEPSAALFYPYARPPYSSGVPFERGAASQRPVIPILSSAPPSAPSTYTLQRATQHNALFLAQYNCTDHHSQHTAQCSSLTDLTFGLGDDSTAEY